jgi:Na+-transporting NADH:ubiquinone oxidoreductase subunit B
MKLLRVLQDKQRPLFEKGGKLERLYPLFEANDTFLFTPGDVTKSASHVRDGIDLKRMMSVVILALLPCTLWAWYNTGAIANANLAADAVAEGWRGAVLVALGLGFSPDNVLACTIHGLLYYLPIFIVTAVFGLGFEVLFCVVRKHEINEGFLVTLALFPLILPASIPLWQVAVGISFGVIIGKEVFGGTGMNILNPALTARAFLFFAYPGQISGDQVWIAVTEANRIDGFSGATPLGNLAVNEAAGVTWMDAFLGTLSGSMGEVSTLACLFGAAVLIFTGVGSWRIMVGVVLGSLGASLLLNAFASEGNMLMALPFHWHVVLGGWAFGLVFMATEPVSAPCTDKGRFVYGLLIGIFVILIRVVNPAYPEGMMLAILLMNVFSPLIDYVSMRGNIKRRLARSAA